MPNGFEGSSEQWHRLERMLLKWDKMLDCIGHEKGVQLVKNAHGWPSRSFEWIDQSIRRKIEVVANDVPVDTFTVWAYAWKDIGTKRLARMFSVKKNSPAAEMAVELIDILNEAWSSVSRLSEIDLVSVVEIKPPIV